MIMVAVALVAGCSGGSSDDAGDTTSPINGAEASSAADSTSQVPGSEPVLVRAIPARSRAMNWAVAMTAGESGSRSTA